MSAQQLELVIDPIESALVKQSEIGAMLIKLPTYKEMKVSGIDDKAGYTAVDTARKEVKKIRVLTTNIAKMGREEAILTQKKWIAKEKELTAQFEETEAHLQAETDRIDAEKKKIEDDRIRAEQERINGRVKLLIDNGCAFNGETYSIGELDISMGIIKNMEDDRFTEFMGAVVVENEKAITAERERLEAIKTEELRIEAEKALEAKRLKEEREELDRKMAEFEKQQAAIKAENERIANEQAEAQRKIDAENQRIENEKAEAVRLENEKIATEKRRIVQERKHTLMTMGMTEYANGFGYKEAESCTIGNNTIHDTPADQWESLMVDVSAQIVKVDEELELKRLADLEEAKEQARKEEAEKIRLENIRISEEEAAHKLALDKAAALAPDKEKLMGLSKQISETKLPECSTEEGKKIVADVQALLVKVQAHIVKHVKTL